MVPSCLKQFLKQQLPAWRAELSAREAHHLETTCFRCTNFSKNTQYPQCQYLLPNCGAQPEKANVAHTFIPFFSDTGALALWQDGMQSLVTSAKIGALILLLSQQLGTNWRETTSCTSCSGMGVNAWRAEIMNQRTLYKVARKLAIKALKSWLSAVACPIYVASHMPRLTMTIWHPLKQLHLCVVLAQLWGFNVFQISSNLCLNMSSYVTYVQPKQTSRRNSRKTLAERSFKRFKWISCMLHSCVQFQISLVIGGHRISAASAKMVTSGVKLEFTILALWCFDKMECSHLWHQPRQAHWYCFFCSQIWTTDASCSTSWAEVLNRTMLVFRMLCWNQSFSFTSFMARFFSLPKMWCSQKECPVWRGVVFQRWKRAYHLGKKRKLLRACPNCNKCMFLAW